MPGGYHDLVLENMALRQQLRMLQVPRALVSAPAIACSAYCYPAPGRGGGRYSSSQTLR
jgi:hypothetical protein